MPSVSNNSRFSRWAAAAQITWRTSACSGRALESFMVSNCWMIGCARPGTDGRSWASSRNAAELPYRDRSFDIVLQSTVFTSLLDPGFQEQVAREMVRVLRRDGWILWYDFRVNNPWNPDVRGVAKRRVNELFPGMASVFYPVTLAPPLIRALVPRFTWLARLLNAFPCSRSHYWAVLWWSDGTRG